MPDTSEMKRFIYAGVSMALVLAACSKNEVFEVNQDGNEIQYSVVANNATKAADIYCNNNKPAEFTVFAKSSDGKTYINGDKITTKDGNTWVNESGTRFWPNDLSLDFYAIVNGTITWDAEENAPATIVDYEVPTTVAGQQDLLYAVKKSQQKGAPAEATKPVILNFRHALSQVVFQAKNTNENLYVEISGVKIVNVANKNTFTFPTSDTDNKTLVDYNHDGSFDSGDYESANWGTWAPLAPESGAAGSIVYPVTFGNVKVPGNNTNATIVNLTNNVYTSPDAGDEFNANALLLLPQTAKAWNPAEVPSPVVTGHAADGSYFLVNCAIYNIAGDEFAATADTPLWGTTAEHKEVAVPVEINWEQGKKYVYTFVFGEGGGFDPDPDPDPDPDHPDPVLVPVTFEVSVDDFVSVANSDIYMEDME